MSNVVVGIEAAEVAVGGQTGLVFEVTDVALTLPVVDTGATQPLHVRDAAWLHTAAA